MVRRLSDATSDTQQMNKILSVFSKIFSVFATLAVVATVAFAIADTVGWRFQQTEVTTNILLPVSILKEQANFQDQV